MGKLPEMTKHRGFPSGLTGTGWQFTIRRANPRGVTKLFEKPRPMTADKTEPLADAAFLTRSGTISVKSLSSAAISMPAGSRACSSVR